MENILNKRNEFLKSLNIKEEDRGQYITLSTESLNEKVVNIITKSSLIKEINNEILNEYINYLDIMGHKESYFKLYKNNNLINIKKYFEANIFISITDFKNKNLDKLFESNVGFSKYLRDNKKLIISPKNAKSAGYKIFLRKI